MPSEVACELGKFVSDKDNETVLDELFDVFARWCDEAERPLVLIFDEIDSAANNQVFLDFLAQLRQQYLQREKDPLFKTFQSVILAGVTDVKH